MVLTAAAVVPGSYMQDAEIEQLNKSAVAIARGTVLYYDPADDSFKLAPVNGVSSKYAVCVKDALAADTKVLAATKGRVVVTADGVIAPHAPVKVSGTTAGQVVEQGATALVADLNAIVGSYEGKVNNNTRDGLSLAACADGDPIIINLKGGLG